VRRDLAVLERHHALRLHRHPDNEIPAAAEPQWQHAVDTYVSESNKTASMWRAVPDDCLDFRPHEKVNTTVRS